MLKQSLQLSIILLTAFYPQVSFGQDFKTAVGGLRDFIMNIVPILTSLAILVFFWGVAEYVFASDDKQAIEDSKKRIIWGIVGLFTIVTIWGIVQFLGVSLSLI
jgi:uncharacterized membrane protein